MQSPEPASAGKAGVGMEGGLAARLACEAAVHARKKASAHAAAAAGKPSETSPSAASPQPAAEGAQAAGLLQIPEAPLMMTVGAAEPMAKRKGGRSPEDQPCPPRSCPGGGCSMPSRGGPGISILCSPRTHRTPLPQMR